MPNYSMTLKPQLDAISKELGLEKPQTIQYLIDFYSFRKVSDFVYRLKKLQQQGLTAQVRASLSVLYSYLNSIEDYLL